MKTIQTLTRRLAATAALVAALALTARAQLTPFTYFNVDWQFNIPVGDSFAGKASGWGANLEGGCYVLPDLAVGAFLSYHTNNEYVPRRTLAVSPSSALTTDQQHSAFRLPFGVAARWRFSDGTWHPYAGLRMGACYAKLSSDYYIYESKDDTWGFYVSPEVGINIYPWPGSVGFHVAAYYSYSTNQGAVLSYDVDGLNNIGFRVGVAF